MAQLKDDCFAFGEDLIELKDALNLLEEKVSTVVAIESVPLHMAQGRFIAEDLISYKNVPPHNNSAVDGYAVFFSDLNPDGVTRLPVTGRIAAGHPLDRPARRGEALRIFTGAPMPEGGKKEPDTIFMDEDCTLEKTAHGDVVVLPEGLKLGANRRFAGEDVKVGDVIINSGQRLRPQEIGLAASVGHDSLNVYKSLRVAVFSTGDEVRDPGKEIDPGCIYDANRHAVIALLKSIGCVVSDLGILQDDTNSITEALAKSSN